MEGRATTFMFTVFAYDQQISRFNAWMMHYQAYLGTLNGVLQCRRGSEDHRRVAPHVAGCLTALATRRGRPGMAGHDMNHPTRLPDQLALHFVFSFASTARRSQRSRSAIAARELRCRLAP